MSTTRHRDGGRAIVGRLILALATVSALIGPACSNQPKTTIEPVYDPQTGVLRLLKYDTDGDGKVDTWRYMDGARVIRVEIDRDRDGRIDRWEHYDVNRNLAKIGISLAGDGVEDAWTYLGVDGHVDRIESSPLRDGKIERVEYFDRGVLSRAEEDTDGDGRIDKWETYEATRLVMVAFDTTGRGIADRRMVYGDNGSVRVEIDARGNGHFEPVTEPPGAGPAGGGGQAPQR
ncbi:MAG: hypothetical protein ABJA98_34155 [Acidobacteriota bacterium]